MKEAQGAKIRAKIIWELKGEECTKYFLQKLEKRKNADQTILSLKSRRNDKILKYQQEMLTEVKTFYEQIYWKKSNVEQRLEINPSALVISRNDQNQSNKQFNFNPKRCGPTGSITQCFKETPNCEKLKMQSTLISRIQKKILSKNRRECNQEVGLLFKRSTWSSNLKFKRILKFRLWIRSMDPVEQDKINVYILKCAFVSNNRYYNKGLWF